MFGYAADFNETADNMGANSLLEVAGVDVTFLFGSLCFLVGGCMELVMWQEEQYGLGFAKKLRNYSAVRADFWQLLIIAAANLNISFAWIRLSLSITAPQNSPSASVRDAGSQWAISEKIIAYHIVLVLLSALHKVPKRHPYDYLTYCLRFMVVFGLVGESFEIRKQMSY